MGMADADTVSYHISISEGPVEESEWLDQHWLIEPTKD